MGLSVIGATKDIPKLVNKYGIGLIFFAISNGPERQRKELIALCEGTGVKTVVIPDLMKVLDESIKVQVEADQI